MIQPEDRVGVGISGGKDSIVLLHVLHKLSTKLKIELYPITIDEGIITYREEGVRTVKATCQTLGLPLTIRSFKDEFGSTLDNMAVDKSHKPCAYCGVFRRKLLNKSAKELGLEKMATGHNLDDEAQAVLMNYLTGDLLRLRRLNGNAATHDLVKRIKPLSRIPEKEVLLYALINNQRYSSAECPYSNENHRTQVRDFLNNQEKERPGIKFSVIKGWERLLKTNIKDPDFIQSCPYCQATTTRNICRACELAQEIKIKMSGVN